ncbi:MAG TPA: hypothetical protein VNN20_17545 [Thermodesulfobacteriota bacterium]|nr:hypothetical protein [Thermodesulfobacteriota bacterium]
MNNKLKSMLIPLIICGFWGTFIYLLGTFIFDQSQIASFLFYSILFGGITSIVSVTLELRIPFIRALVVGLLSGFIYQVLSPIFPFLSSVLAGVSLGGGLIADEGKWGDFFNRIFSTIKGVFVLPFFIYTGGLITGISSGIFDSDFFLWFFWGAWIGLGVCLITISIFSTDDTEEDFKTLSELDEFKSEVRQILRELDQMESRFGCGTQGNDI